MLMKRQGKSWQLVFPVFASTPESTLDFADVV